MDCKWKSRKTSARVDFSFVIRIESLRSDCLPTKGRVFFVKWANLQHQDDEERSKPGLSDPSHQYLLADCSNGFLRNLRCRIFPPIEPESTSRASQYSSTTVARAEQENRPSSSDRSSVEPCEKLAHSSDDQFVRGHAAHRYWFVVVDGWCHFSCTDQYWLLGEYAARRPDDEQTDEATGGQRRGRTLAIDFWWPASLRIPRLLRRAEHQQNDE